MWTGIVSAAVLCCPLFAAPPGIEITIERRQGTAWRPVDSSLVFFQGDRLRFRIRSGLNGYLYVMNRATSGAYTTLFPSEEAGQGNRIEAGKEYTIPSTNGSFRVTGPPGQDIVYWVMSPVALTGIAPPPRPAPPASMTPRCDDTVFRARGECVDSTAGPRQSGGKVPENLDGVKDMTSRGITFIKQQEKLRVLTEGQLEGPVIYELRIAHR